MVRPAPQPPCAHPSTRRRLRPASHCLPAAPFLRGRWRSATPSSALPEGTHRLNLADDLLKVTVPACALRPSPPNRTPGL